MESKYIVGIEIGSSKIKGAVGCVDSNGSLSVQIVEEQPLIDCVRYGVIQNVEIVANTVNDILHRIEQRMMPRKVEGVYVAVGGLSLCTTHMEVQRQLPEEMEITRNLTAQLKTEGANTALNDRDVIGYAPLLYLIDGKVSERPEGTYGTNIRLQLNLISCKSRLKCNINRVLADKLNLKVFNYIIRPTAEADLVLTSEEKRSGCMFVDFGAETTTVSIYKKGSLQYLATLPLGSRNITFDLCKLLHLEETAETVNCTMASANPNAGLVAAHQSIEGVDADKVYGYVSARAGEIIANIAKQVEYAGYKPADLPAGIVVVGGGAKLRDFITRLESDSKMKVRLGMPSQSVRIADGRIQPADSIDIISVLFGALPEAEECMPEPKPVIPEPIQESEPAQPDEDAIQPEQPVRQTYDYNTPKKEGFFSRIRRGVNKFIMDPDDLMDEDD